MAETVPEATVHEVDEILGSGIDKLKETIANEDEKIDNRIGALLLLLRSRRNVEENMQVDAHSASPQLSESPDFNRPDPKPSHVINVTPEIPKASSLSTRRYKLHRRVSLEEINERRLKGLCVFCNELETPNHHLKHKNLGILMIDGDEDQLPNGELSVTIEHRMVNLVQEAREENPKLENHKDLVEKAILEEESIPQFQVPISDSENLRNIELREENSKLETLEYVVMNENEKLEQDGAQKYVNRKFEVDGAVERSQKVSSTKNCCAHQVFGKMSKHEEKLGIKKKRKGFKSRMFKYKRGLRKLHTLTFSKSMSMVFSQPLGMVETSSDLLMWNGKDSLPRTAIGSELEAMETDSSSQEGSELCTEKKEEVKGYFDRFQSLVLMKGITDSSSNDEELMKEEDSLKVYEVHRETQIVDSGQWLGYDLIITCLENKNNWTKLRVKKWENLCWKEAASDESRSISICCIMKLGGVAFIYKNVLERIHNENLEILACQAMLEGSVPTKIIDMDRSKRLGSSEILYARDDLRNQESSQFFVIQQVMSNTKIKPDLDFLGIKPGLGEQSVYDRIILVKEQLLQTSLVIQEVMRNEKIKFSKRWWFKYKFGEAGLTRQSSSNLYMTYYFAVWHCWKSKTMVCVEMSGDQWSWMVLVRKSATSSFLLLLYDQRMGVIHDIDREIVSLQNRIHSGSPVIQSIKAKLQKYRFSGQGYIYILYRDHQGRCRLKQSKLPKTWSFKYKRRE